MSKKETRQAINPTLSHFSYRSHPTQQSFATAFSKEPIMAHEAKKASRRTETPRTCDECLRETAKSDQRRALIRLATEDEWRFVESEVRR